jgi:hypothetical protein
MVRLLKRSPFGAVVPGVVGATAAHPELAAAARTYLERRRPLVQAAIERGIERGELPADADPHHILDLLLAPFYFRHLITGDPVNNAFAERVCDSVLVAAGARQPPAHKKKEKQR